MSFIDDIQNIGNSISLKKIRDVAIKYLPFSEDEQRKLYDELLRGTEILDDEPHMNMYLKSYGHMHSQKIYYSLDHMPHVRQLLSGNLELFDWGCGQGMATICTLFTLVSTKALLFRNFMRNSKNHNNKS